MILIKDAFFQLPQDALSGLGPKLAAMRLKAWHKLGKLRMRCMKIDYNATFARAHDYQPKKNHWKHALIYVGLGEQPHPGCKACLDVMAGAAVGLAEAASRLPDQGDATTRRTAKPAGEGRMRGRPKKRQPTKLQRVGIS